jgi:hypothetical protein
MRLFLFSFCFTLITSFISAQTNQRLLISLDLKRVNDLNVIENLQMQVIHLFDDLLITRADMNVIKKLKDLNIGFQIIDKNISDAEYYLATPKKKSLHVDKPETGSIVFERFNEFILKNPGSIENLISSGYNIAKLSDSPVIFKNEKIIFNNPYFSVDTTISNIVSNINADSVEYFIQSLQNFQTRFLFANTRDSVASWIKYQFLRFGFTDVKLDSFQYQGTWQMNVVATITGNIYPEKIYVFGGHHDSYSSGDPMIFAPGADDNASGTAAALEVARIIMQSGYQPKSTIKFITFAAEEYGLWGSKHYAEYALNQGMDIKLMINHDMISHDTSPLHLGSVDINRYTQGSEVWSDMAIDIVNLYSVLTPYFGSTNSSSSDSYSFWQRGFDVVYFQERDFSPYYHSPQDVISNYNMPYCAEVIKSSGALLLTAIKMPSVIENYFLYDVGNGTSLSLMWLPNLDPDFANYKIYIGLNTGNYFQTFTTSDTSHIIENLTEGTTYYVAVSSVSSDGSESFLTERSMTPYSIPLAPENLIAVPKWHAVDLSWGKNIELDFAGYNLYRSIDSTGNYNKINTQLLTDTLFSDATVSSGIKYYYYVKAQDADNNESEKSNLVASRAVTLDRGILLVDATADGNGSLLNPTDLEVDEFYNSILSGFIKSDYDINSEGEISVMELAPYSTVIWQKDDNQNTIYSSQVIKVIKDYLDYGGKLLFVGHRPARVFGGLTSGGGSYGAGSFLFDYLKIDSSLYRNAARFQGGVSLTAPYLDIFYDSTKTNPTLNYHLLGIESIVPGQTANAIYKYETQFDSSTSFGSMKHQPVGVEYIGSDYKVITISFPLYYMNEPQAKALIETVLINKFNEVTGIGSDNGLKFTPTEFALEQNYPNPFNPSTKISWQSPVGSHQTIKVYDVLGNEVATLVDEYKNAGRYEVEFNAINLSSGVYFYQIQAGEFVKTKKMILIR